ncbi:MAG: hypothetical protein KAU47_01875 [Candidatus Aminicenantes bacterium]|nr:hypothetical protein [Candidatus Aminicenantes bacterium]
MKVFWNFGRGFIATGRVTKMVLFLYIVNLLFSLLLAIPMYSSLKDSLGQSEAGSRMAEGFDYIWWEEFRDDAKGLETTFSPSIIGKGAILNNLESLIQMRFFFIPPLLMAFGLFYIIFRVFLAGGILSTFNKDIPRFTLREFSQGAGTQFFRFLSLMLLSWGLIMAIGIFFLDSINSIINDIAAESTTEVTPFILRLALSALTFAFLLFVQMVFDYARIKIVLEKSRNIFKSTLEALGFVFKHPFSTFGLFYLIFLIQAAVTLAYILLKEIIPQSNFPLVLAAFFIQQLFIFALIWIRCLFYSSQMALYRYMK